MPNHYVVEGWTNMQIIKHEKNGMVTIFNIYRQHRQVEKINKKYIDVKALKMQHQPENMIQKNMIPKNIILTYKTKNVDEFPEFYRLCFDRMVEFFNDYEIKIFDDTDMDVLVRSFDSKLYEVYQQCEIIRKTDIFRLVALHVYGGIYMDLDVYLEKKTQNLTSSNAINQLYYVSKN
jgi:mannosyltransferase OCH1-like enzyme